ncbi:MAG: glycosyltransferase [Deltaproteobacteria bacterium]|nr:glycosyltransferase [Deltaproteobacteria bacterium]
MNRVAHLITGLGVGGAELALAQLLRAGGPGDEVICLKDLGPVATLIEAAGTPCWSLGVEKKTDLIRALPRLRRHLHQTQPQVLITWLYHANILGFVAAERTKTAVVWNVRGSHADESGRTDGFNFIQRVSAKISNKGPSKIIAVSHSAQYAHELYGYDPNKFEVIENGVDGNRFFPDEYRRHQFRARLEIPPSSLVIGHIGRNSLMKDHANLFQAFEQLRNQFSKKAVLVCIGENVPELQKQAPADVILLPTSTNIALDYPGFDVLALASARGEGFPNALAEAMASGICVVTTDVGDARRMMVNQESVVPTQNSSALAGALLRTLQATSDEREQQGVENRAHILKWFSTEKMVQRYWNLVNALVS